MEDLSPYDLVIWEAMTYVELAHATWDNSDFSHRNGLRDVKCPRINHFHASASCLKWIQLLALCASSKLVRTYVHRRSLASSERKWQRNLSLGARNALLSYAHVRDCRRKHPELSVGYVIECGGVYAEVPSQDLFWDMSHPVGECESRIFAKRSIIENLCSRQISVL